MERPIKGKPLQLHPFQAAVEHGALFEKIDRKIEGSKEIFNWIRCGPL